MVEWWNRADRERRAQRKTYEEIALDMGVSMATVGHWMTGRRQPSPTKLAGLARLLGVSLDYLMEGEECEMSDEKSPARYRTRRVMSVPLLEGSQVSAFIDGRLEASKVRTEVPLYDVQGVRSFAFRVSGDSMADPHGHPTFPDGTVVVIDPDKPAGPGDFVLAQGSAQDEPHFKRWIQDGGEHFLAPLNPRYPMRPFVPEDELVGRAVVIAQLEL